MDEGTSGGRCFAPENKRHRKSLETQKRYEEYKLCVMHPELLSFEDISSPSVLLLNALKGMPGSVPVPSHWASKRAFRHTKRALQRKLYVVPDEVVQTGICDARKRYREDVAEMPLKKKLRLKLRPRLHGGDVDYDKLVGARTHVALSRFGELYCEDRRSDDVYGEMTPGKLSQDLRKVLGMGANTPPPWLHNMQRYGLPPAYPNLSVPGINAPIPQGCKFGPGKDCWGTPPLDSSGQPVYPGVYEHHANRPLDDFFVPADFSVVRLRRPARIDVGGGGTPRKVFDKESGRFVEDRR